MFTRAKGGGPDDPPDEGRQSHRPQWLRAPGRLVGLRSGALCFATFSSPASPGQAGGTEESAPLPGPPQRQCQQLSRSLLLVFARSLHQANGGEDSCLEEELGPRQAGQMHFAFLCFLLLALLGIGNQCFWKFRSSPSFTVRAVMTNRYLNPLSHWMVQRLPRH